MQAQTQRPQRRQLPNFLGKMLTLQDGPPAYQCLWQWSGTEVVHFVLGSGPLLVQPCAPPELLCPKATVFIVHSPSFLQQIHAFEKQGAPSTPFAQRLPKHWQRIPAQEFIERIQSTRFTAVWWNTQNLELESDFWLPLLGCCQAQHIYYQAQCVSSTQNIQYLQRQNSAEQSKSQAQETKKPYVLLGTAENTLLHIELEKAFTDLGYAPYPCITSVQTGHKGHTLRHWLQHKASEPQQCALFFSTNLQGLDVHGHDFALLQALRIPVAIWFVDNPWHVLASLRLPWWKKATLFVTDASFIPHLRNAGASHVYHLPLAVAQHMWEETPKKHGKDIEIKTKTIPQNHNRNSNNEKHSPLFPKALTAAQQASCIFVGRAAFPQKKSFFAAAKVPQNLLHEGVALLEASHAQQIKPDFHWWAQHLNLEQEKPALPIENQEEKSIKAQIVKHSSPFWPGHAVRQMGLGAEHCAQRHRVLWLEALMHAKSTTTPWPAIFGDAPLWQTLLPTAPAHIFHDSVDYYTQLPLLYTAAFSVLNVTSLLLPWGLTQRHFDVWAAGGFLWTNATKGLDIFPQDLTDPITLAHPRLLPSALKQLTLRHKEALQKSWQEHLHEKHQYVHRMLEVLEKTQN